MIEYKFTPTHTKLNKMRNSAVTTSSNKSDFLYFILFQLTYYIFFNRFNFCFS